MECGHKVRDIEIIDVAKRLVRCKSCGCDFVLTTDRWMLYEMCASILRNMEREKTRPRDQVKQPPKVQKPRPVYIKEWR